MHKVAMAVIGRENWGRLEPLADYLQNKSWHGPWPKGTDWFEQVAILCGGASVIERFKTPADEIEAAGFEVHRCYSELDGDSLVVKARSLGLTTMDYAATLDRLKPDVLILIGDRYEALGVASAAVTLRIPILHIQGGEVSGALDERYRHSISKLADYHIPATERARQNLIRMGERPSSILTVGCPSSDMARTIEIRKTQEQPYLLVVYHPDTNHAGGEAAQMQAVLQAVAATGIHAKVLWPNIDSGSGEIAKVIRQHADDFETIKNLPPREYMELIANAACCVGNSSSFVRDSGFFGTPVVLVGTRQNGRECGPNVVRTICAEADIRWGIKQQLDDGRHEPWWGYGDGHVCERIVKALLDLPPYSPKRLAYDVEMEWKRAGSAAVEMVVDWTGAE